MATSKRVQFKSGPWLLVGDLYLPEEDLSSPKAGLVFSGPFTGVKEQVTGLYARRLAEQGWVCLAFDHRHFGESEGEPRQHEDSAGKLTDLAAAVSFLRQQAEVDPERIGACGICLGTSYVLKFAAFDPRVKAIALIAGAYNSPHTMRRLMGSERYRERLAHFAHTREQYWQTGELPYIPAVAETGAAAMPGAEPYEYYGTARSASPHWVNQVTTLSTYELITLEAAAAADFIAPTPMLMVHGQVDAYCSPESAQATYERAGEPKKLVWLPTHNHIDLYDVEDYVGPAVAETAHWFQTYLG
ncbi:alpha/beta hydrolase [Synechococcus sp. Nb3U1]|uniref:alpha/beta hydrolase n=1 Tax=Synechococcus sp. Nb3U1 TaxID=1914529 RepID=UPI001F20FD9A|nr:alpha/beta hydrolase [Synechococcus sp. Nb3U1]MCF2969729.1 alpha/beta hydrolase [Synechococcus sp. Nb3U1]